MAQIVGKYKHERNENLDEYFKAIGVPYIPRKMMSMSHPQLEIVNDNGNWTITSTTMVTSVVAKFKLNEEYEENMPGGIIKSKTKLEDNKLITSSIAPTGAKISRIYEFSETGCILILKHENSGIEAWRYYIRLSS